MSNYKIASESFMFCSIQNKQNTELILLQLIKNMFIKNKINILDY